MTRIFVKPALDKSAEQEQGQPPARLKLRKPTGPRLSPDGEWQNLDSYWQRRINDGDVEVVEGAIEPKEEPAAPSAAAAAAPGAADPGGSKAVVTSKSK